MGEWVQIAGRDGLFRAYVARPAGAPKAAVVTIQEIFGVNGVMRGKADWLAREGFLAIAPDLFWRLEKDVDITDQSEAEWNKAFDLMKRFDIDAGVNDIQATIDHARGLVGDGKVGAIGYCLGGLLAYLSATRTDADASVGYYGVNIPNFLAEADNIRAPLLLHIAGKDGFVPPDKQKDMRDGFADNAHVTLHEYAERDHAFTREGGKNYDGADARVADERTNSVLQGELGMKRIALICAMAFAACDGAPSANIAEAPTNVQALTPTDIGAFFDCLRENGQTVVAAHRGGPAPGFAENAIPTFENTLRQAPALLEVDIARTRDNVLVLMHDDEVDRTTTGTGLVRDLTLAQLQALQLEDENGQTLDARVPSFRETLDWADGRAVLELDVKRGVSYEDVIAEVRGAGAEARVIFISYSDDAAVRVHRLAPELMLSVSIDEAGDLGVLEQRGVDLTKVLAWTGTNEPNAALNVALAQRGVEAMFGTLGNPARSWDGRFAREGREQYAAFAETGLQLIATDRPVEASRDLDVNDGADGIASMQCVAR